MKNQKNQKNQKNVDVVEIVAEVEEVATIAEVKVVEELTEIEILQNALKAAQEKIALQNEELKAKRVKVTDNSNKSISNTQKCANLIIQLAEDSKHTRSVIVETVSSILTALSVVTVKTMLSDLHNSKYAKKYSNQTIVTDRDTKIVSINKTL